MIVRHLLVAAAALALLAAPAHAGAESASAGDGAADGAAVLGHAPGTSDDSEPESGTVEEWWRRDADQRRYERSWNTPDEEDDWTDPDLDGDWTAPDDAGSGDELEHEDDGLGAGDDAEMDGE